MEWSNEDKEEWEGVVDEVMVGIGQYILHFLNKEKLQWKMERWGRDHIILRQSQIIGLDLGIPRNT